jgi:hypothetical protein
MSRSPLPPAMIMASIFGWFIERPFTGEEDVGSSSAYATSISCRRNLF